MRFTNQIMNKKAERRELGFGCCFLLCFCVFVFFFVFCFFYAVGLIAMEVTLWLGLMITCLYM
jgi:hypothetical protein